MNQQLAIQSSYTITTDTLTLEPLNTLTTATLVREKHQSLIVDQPVITILSSNCELDGSTMLLRKKLMQFCMNQAIKKIPVVVNVKDGLVMMPTTSISSRDCCWISLNRIRKCYPVPRQKETLVLFKCNEHTTIPVSVTQFTANLKRADKAFHQFLKHSSHH
ncbi:competence protein ComK [Salisediminibacterium beveridgei]|uniref:ComK protein n=1 Tax=Salisediminibacterium beveridgei TaxID=632773 RepID=A0A1D7QS69_9BACI|nr:competence protein ComK [Salisediminibacterium beveridgei]AOM81862.1 hypothetical protein BBEV_0469 [Salisediminibacterium beveridgei]